MLRLLSPVHHQESYCSSHGAAFTVLSSPSGKVTIAATVLRSLSPVHLSGELLWQPRCYVHCPQFTVRESYYCSHGAAFTVLSSPSGRVIIAATVLRSRLQFTFRESYCSSHGNVFTVSSSPSRRVTVAATVLRSLSPVHLSGRVTVAATMLRSLSPVHLQGELL